MKIKKENIYVTFIIILILCIISLIILKSIFQVKKYKINNNIYGSWQLYMSKQYVDGNLTGQADNLKGMYFIIDNDNFNICFLDINEVQQCIINEYSISEKNLIVYGSDTSTQYTYDLKDNDTLILTYIDGTNTVLNYCARVQG